MKLFTAPQIKELDLYTIKHTPITSIDLMERAAKAFTHQFCQLYPHQTVHIIAGKGHNGGDALAVARLLLQQNRIVSTWLVNDSGELSVDTQKNLDHLLLLFPKSCVLIDDLSKTEDLKVNDVIIDGLLGSGLNRPTEGLYLDIITHINALNKLVVAIDVPSGLSTEGVNINPPEAILKASQTVTFQFPKLSFLYPENEPYLGPCYIVDIGLHPQGIQNTETNDHYLHQNTIAPLLKKRTRFAHKGTFGHALLFAGSKGKIGAAVLASRACIRGGVGLLTTQVPNQSGAIIHNSVPEAMVIEDINDLYLTTCPSTTTYAAIGIGPGLGTSSATKEMMLQLLKQHPQKPLVIDADALNLISQHPELGDLLPPGCILTPHIGEFDRLVGSSKTTPERINKAQKLASRWQAVVVLKGAHTLIATPSGACYFNSTGNAGMATAGSGDVLTGLLLALLAQGYSATNAALLGVYTHGLAGDLCFEKETYEGLTASGIITQLGSAFKQIRSAQ